MHRIAIETPIVAVAGAILASLVLVAGIAIEPSPEPIVLSGKILLPAGGTGGCLDAPMSAPSTRGAAGEMKLCPDDRDLLATLRVGGLEPGASYSAWLSVAPQPTLCTVSYCEPSGMADAGWAEETRRIGTGFASTSRTVEFGAILHDVPRVSGVQISMFLLLPPGPRAAR
jgi:hypothetical protein